LKAGFFLEMGTSPDTGKTVAADGPVFDRESNMFISGGFGELRIGKITTDFTDSDVFVNATTSHVAGMNQALVGSAIDGSNTRVKVETTGGDSANNTIQYTLPVWNGVKAQVFRSESSTSISATTGSEVTGESLNTVEGFSIRYTQGNLKATLGQASKRVAGAGKVEKATSMGASYDFGVVRVGAIRAVRDNTDTTVNDKGTADVFSVAVPVNAKVTLVGAYHSYSNDKAATYDGKATVVGATYDFSKRTAAYVTHAFSKNESTGNYSVSGQVGTAAGADEKITSVGIKHFF
jgi:predicted porin